MHQGISDIGTRLNHYWSQAVFQKGQLVIDIVEIASRPDGRLTERVIEEIARAIKGDK